MPNRVRAVAHDLEIAMAVSGHHVVSAMTSALIVHHVMSSSLWMDFLRTIPRPMTAKSPWNGLSVLAILQHPRWQQYPYRQRPSRRLRQRL